MCSHSVDTAAPAGRDRTKLKTLRALTLATERTYRAVRWQLLFGAGLALGTPHGSLRCPKLPDGFLPLRSGSSECVRLSTPTPTNATFFHSG